jgi:hypothetical protein
MGQWVTLSISFSKALFFTLKKRLAMLALRAGSSDLSPLWLSLL